MASACYPGSGNCVDRFISRHTLLPYLLAFDPSRRREHVLSQVRGSRNASAAQLLHISSLRETLPHHLQLCPECYRADLQVCGEPYWHRLQQLPGVFHCPRHGCLLHSSRVPLDVDVSLQAITPAQAKCQFDATTAVAPRFAPSLERLLIRPTMGLIDMPLSRCVLPSVQAYRCALSRLGFEGPAQTIRMSKFEGSFASWLGRHGCEPNSLGHDRWWVPLITEVHARTTTLQHLVLRAFIGSRHAWLVGAHSISPRIAAYGGADGR